jgi:hypothetical protein
MTAYTTGPGEVAPDGTPIEHYANIVNKNFNVVGVGIADGPFGRSWVNDFGQTSGGTPPPSPPPSPPAGAPVIVKFAPSHAAVGAYVVIQCTGVDTQTTASFNGVQATEYGLRSDIGLEVRIPAGATTGTLIVRRGSDGAMSAGVPFTVDAAPVPPPSPTPTPAPHPPTPTPAPGALAVAVTVAPTGRISPRPGVRISINITGGQAPFRVTGNIAGRNLPNLSPGRVSLRDTNGARGEVVTIHVVDGTGASATGTATV